MIRKEPQTDEERREAEAQTVEEMLAILDRQDSERASN